MDQIVISQNFKSTLDFDLRFQSAGLFSFKSILDFSFQNVKFVWTKFVI